MYYKKQMKRKIHLLASMILGVSLMVGTVSQATSNEESSEMKMVDLTAGVTLMYDVTDTEQETPIGINLNGNSVVIVESESGSSYNNIYIDKNKNGKIDEGETAATVGESTDVSTSLPIYGIYESRSETPISITLNSGQAPKLYGVYNGEMDVAEGVAITMNVNGGTVGVMLTAAYGSKVVTAGDVAVDMNLAAGTICYSTAVDVSTVDAGANANVAVDIDVTGTAFVPNNFIAVNGNYYTNSEVTGAVDVNIDLDKVPTSGYNIYDAKGLLYSNVDGDFNMTVNNVWSYNMYGMRYAWVKGNYTFDMKPTCSSSYYTKAMEYSSVDGNADIRLVGFTAGSTTYNYVYGIEEHNSSVEHAVGGTCTIDYVGGYTNRLSMIDGSYQNSVFVGDITCTVSGGEIYNLYGVSEFDANSNIEMIIKKTANITGYCYAVRNGDVEGDATVTVSNGNKTNSYSYFYGAYYMNIKGDLLVTVDGGYWYDMYGIYGSSSGGYVITGNATVDFKNINVDQKSFGSTFNGTCYAEVQGNLEISVTDSEFSSFTGNYYSKVAKNLVTTFDGVDVSSELYGSKSYEVGGTVTNTMNQVTGQKVYGFYLQSGECTGDVTSTITGATATTELYGVTAYNRTRLFKGAIHSTLKDSSSYKAYAIYNVETQGEASAAITGGTYGDSTKNATLFGMFDLYTPEKSTVEINGTSLVGELTPYKAYYQAGQGDVTVAIEGLTIDEGNLTYNRITNQPYEEQNVHMTIEDSTLSEITRIIPGSGYGKGTATYNGAYYYAGKFVFDENLTKDTIYFVAGDYHIPKGVTVKANKAFYYEGGNMLLEGDLDGSFEGLDETKNQYTGAYIFMNGGTLDPALSTIGGLYYPLHVTASEIGGSITNKSTIYAKRHAFGGEQLFGRVGYKIEYAMNPITGYKLKSAKYTCNDVTTDIDVNAAGGTFGFTMPMGVTSLDVVFDGKELVLGKATSDPVLKRNQEYTVETPAYDLSTVMISNDAEEGEVSFAVDANEGLPKGLALSEDGTKIIGTPTVATAGTKASIWVTGKNGKKAELVLNFIISEDGTGQQTSQEGRITVDEEGKAIYLSGNSVIVEAATDGKTAIYLDDDRDGKADYKDAVATGDYSAYTMYGVSNTECNTSVRITMNGGNVNTIYGAYYGTIGKSGSKVDVYVNGGTVSTVRVLSNSTLNGTVKMVIKPEATVTTKAIVDSYSTYSGYYYDVNGAISINKAYNVEEEVSATTISITAVGTVTFQKPVTATGNITMSGSSVNNGKVVFKDKVTATSSTITTHNYVTTIFNGDVEVAKLQLNSLAGRETQIKGNITATDITSAKSARATFGGTVDVSTLNVGQTSIVNFNGKTTIAGAVSTATSSDTYFNGELEAKDKITLVQSATMEFNGTSTIYEIDVTGTATFNKDATITLVTRAQANGQIWINKGVTFTTENIYKYTDSKIYLKGALNVGRTYTGSSYYGHLYVMEGSTLGIPKTGSWTYLYYPVTTVTDIKGTKITLSATGTNLQTFKDGGQTLSFARASSKITMTPDVVPGYDCVISLNGEATEATYTYMMSEPLAITANYVPTQITLEKGFADPEGVVGTEYTATQPLYALRDVIVNNDTTATYGGELVYSLGKDSVLPEGLTLDEDGNIVGTPTTASEDGMSVTFDIKGRNGTTASLEVKIVIHEAGYEMIDINDTVTGTTAAINLNGTPVVIYQNPNNSALCSIYPDYDGNQIPDNNIAFRIGDAKSYNLSSATIYGYNNTEEPYEGDFTISLVSGNVGTIYGVKGTSDAKAVVNGNVGVYVHGGTVKNNVYGAYYGTVNDLTVEATGGTHTYTDFIGGFCSAINGNLDFTCGDEIVIYGGGSSSNEAKVYGAWNTVVEQDANLKVGAIDYAHGLTSKNAGDGTVSGYQETRFSSFKGLYSATVKGNYNLLVEGYWYPRYETLGNVFAYSSTIDKNMTVRLKDAVISNGNRSVETCVADRTTIGGDLDIYADEGTTLTTYNEFYILSGNTSSAKNLHLTIPESCSGNIGNLYVFEGNPTVTGDLYSNNKGYIDIGNSYTFKKNISAIQIEVMDGADVTIEEGVTVTVNASIAQSMTGTDSVLTNYGTLNLQADTLIYGKLDNYGVIKGKSKNLAITDKATFINREGATVDTYTFASNGNTFNYGTFSQNYKDVALGTIYSTKPLSLMGENSEYAAGSTFYYPVTLIYPKNCVEEVSLAEDSLSTIDFEGDDNQYIKGGTAFVLTVGETINKDVELTAVKYGEETASKQSDGTWTGTVPFAPFEIELVYEASEGVDNIELETASATIENTESKEILVFGNSFDENSPLYDLTKIGILNDLEEETGSVMYAVETNSSLPTGLSLVDGKIVGELKEATDEQQVVKFIVKGKNQTTATFTLTIGAISKMVPEWSVPTGFTAKVGEELSSVALPISKMGTYDWPDATVSVGKTATTITGVDLLFKPKDIDNYNWEKTAENAGATYKDGVITCQISIQVAAGVPEYDVPTNVTATYGQTLRDVEIPSGNNDGVFIWTDKLYTSVGEAGTQYFNAKYVPNDKNYETVYEIPIKVVVNKAQASYETIESVSAICGQTLNDITLPSVAGGQYQWITLKNTVPQDGKVYTMGYKPNDIKNYNWETIKGWDAAWSMVKFDVVVNLTHTYADTWTYDEEQHWHACNGADCSEKSDVADHEWDDGEVITPATETTTGLRKYACACGATKTETLPVLTHTNHVYGEEWKYNSTKHWHVCITDDCSATTTPELHVWDEGVVVTPATELTEGSMKYTCICGATKTETIEKLEHTNHTFTGAWSHDEDGHWKVCTFDGCEEHSETEVHQWGEGVVTKLPTETTTGIRKYTCLCGRIKTETIEKLEHTNHTFTGAWSYDEDGHWRACAFTGCQEVSEKEDHVWDEGAIVKEATEETTGTIKYTCKCGATKTDVIPVLTHKTHVYDETWSYNEQFHWHVCTYEDCVATSAKEEHVWGDGVVVKPATELAVGSMKYTCKCGATKTEVIEKLEHTNHIYDGKWLHDKDGHWKACTFENCDTLSDKEPHEWDEGVVITPATELAEGSMKYTCKCGETKTETIDKLEHTNHVYDGAWLHDAEGHWKDCTFEGCNQLSQKEAHEWDEGVVVTPATELAEGSMKYTCACGETKLEVIEKLEHTKHTYGVAWKYDEDYHWKVCTFEGCEEIALKSVHEWDEGVVIVAPTEKTEGSMKHTCKCGATKTEVIEKIEHTKHTYGDEWLYDEDSHWKVCTFDECDETTEPEGHTWDEIEIIKPATETEIGTKKYTCKCGITKTEDIPILPHADHTYDNEWMFNSKEHWHECTYEGCSGITTPTAHEWGEGVEILAPTELSEGKMEYTCECGAKKTEVIEKLEHKNHVYEGAYGYDEEYHWQHCTFEGCEEVSEKIEHDWTEGETLVEPTETSEGSIEYVCECGAQIIEGLPMLPHMNHVFGDEWKYNENCHWQTCTFDGCIFVGDATAHEWDAGVVETQATDAASGVMKYTCKVCGMTRTEAIEQEEHVTHVYEEKWSFDEDEHWHACTNSDCDETADLAKHLYGNPEVVVEATEDEEGTRKYTCQTCGYSYTEEYDLEEDEKAEKLEIDEEFEDEVNKMTYVVTSENDEIELASFDNDDAEEVTIPKTVTYGETTYTVTSIAPEAFKNHKKLKKIVIGDNILSIGKKAFYGCKKLTTVVMGANVKTIGESAFQNCIALKKITLPASVISIGKKAFYGCKKLTTVKMSKNLETIGNSAFQNCVALKKIEIPSKVKKIGSKAFYGCKALTNITIKTTKLNTSRVGKSAFTKAGSKNYKKLKVKVPKKKLKAYKTMLKKRGLSSKAKVTK